MRRRTLLAGIGALFTGCLGSVPPQTVNGTSSAPTSDSPTTTMHSRGTETPSTGFDGEMSEYRVSDLTVSTNTNRPSVKYVLEPEELYSGDAVERSENRTGDEYVVRDISTVNDDDVRAAIEAAIQTGSWRSNELPDGLADTVEQVDFFTGVSQDDTYTHIGLALYRLHSDRPPAVEFSATLADNHVSAESPGAIELALTNSSSTTQTVVAGIVPPFGMVSAQAIDGGDGFLLWRAYDENDCIYFTDESWSMCSVGTLTEIEAGERISRRYEILPDTTAHHPEHTAPPSPGKYVISGGFGYYEVQGAPETALSFEVQFTLGKTE